MKLLLHQFRAEQRLFWRSRELAFFTFLLPIVFFLILGSAYGDEDIDGDDGYLYLLAGMIGYGAAATTFAGLALLLVLRREAGVLKRIRVDTAAGDGRTSRPCLRRSRSCSSSRPSRSSALRASRSTWRLPATLLSLVARRSRSVRRPSRHWASAHRGDPERRGLVGRGERDLPPVTFISGSFFGSGRLSGGAPGRRGVAAARPLHHLVRDVMVFDDRIWDHPTAVAIVAAWGLVGAHRRHRGFQWEPRER